MDLGTVITSKSNARVKELRASFNGKAAGAGELLGLEGETLLLEAHRSGLMFETIYVREGQESLLVSGPLHGLLAKSRVVLREDVFASAVDTSSPQGVAATWAITEPKQVEEMRGLVLVLENLQDPGNLGTLLRSAEAFGVEQVMVTPDTVSQWNPKTLRASAGSAFRMPVLRASMKDVGNKLREAKVKVFAAVVEKAHSVTPMDADLDTLCAVLIGNEGAGLSAEALELAEQQIRIPCAVESLNAAVAASTLMYEAMRQRFAGAGNGEFKKRVLGA